MPRATYSWFPTDNLEVRVGLRFDIDDGTVHAIEPLSAKLRINEVWGTFRGGLEAFASMLAYDCEFYGIVADECGRQDAERDEAERNQRDDDRFERARGVL